MNRGFSPKDFLLEFSIFWSVYSLVPAVNGVFIAISLFTLCDSSEAPHSKTEQFPESMNADMFFIVIIYMLKTLHSMIQAYWRQI